MSGDTEKVTNEKRKVGDGTPGPGRPKGVPNRMTRELKEMILGALESVGGMDYLAERAQDPKTMTAFMSLVGKVLPLQLSGEGGGAVVVTLRPDDAEG